MVRVFGCAFDLDFLRAALPPPACGCAAVVEGGATVAVAPARNTVAVGAAVIAVAALSSGCSVGCTRAAVVVATTCCCCCCCS